MGLNNFGMISVALLALCILSFFVAVVAGQNTFEVESTTVKVYRDGLVHVLQTLNVDDLCPEMNLHLLSPSVENLIILDEDLRVIDYQLTAANLTVFTLGAAQVSIEYDTNALTNKNADVWTLVLSNPYNLTVLLPQNSTIIYLSQVPAAIDTSNAELSLVLNPRQWEISYIFPLQQEDQNDDSVLPAIPLEYFVAAAIAVSATIAIVTLFILRKRKINVQKILNRNPGMKKEDIVIIEFLAENDGEAFEAEIRKCFPDMPRTSLWRLIRRLERLEIVEVKKIGHENQVKIRK
jgi:uncharacterized membrane protein